MDNNIDNEIQAADAKESNRTIEIDTSHKGGYHKNAQGHTVLYDENGYNPKLDPDNPAFDLEYLKEKEAQGWTQLREIMDETKERMLAIQKEKELFSQCFYLCLEIVSANAEIDPFQIMDDGQDENEDIIPGSPLDTALDYAEDMQQFIKKELQNEEYGAADFSEIYPQGIDENEDIIPGSLLDKLISRAVEYIVQVYKLEKLYADARKSERWQPIAKPQSYKILNSKIAKSYVNFQDYLTKLDNNGQLTWLPLNDQQNKAKVMVKQATNTAPPVLSVVSLTYNGDLQGKLSKINSYDLSILNTIYSLILAGNRAFLIEDIYKTMTQKSKVTDKQLNKIRERLYKLHGHRIRIDVSEELKAGILKLNDERIINGFFEDDLIQLPLLDVVTESGSIKTALSFDRNPILLQYSLAKNHEIITEPVSLLEMKCRATEETISIRDYLIREIHQLKRGYRKNQNINYENLLNFIGFDMEKKNRTYKQRITQDVLTILDGFKEKNFIKDYQVINGAKNKILDFKIIIEDNKSLVDGQ